MQALATLAKAKDLDVEEAAAKDADEEDLEDDGQGWIDKCEAMTDNERAALDESSVWKSGYMTGKRP